MIEQITLDNFLSFKDKKTFNFLASMEKPKKGYEFMKWYDDVNHKKILKFQFLFGNNGTGKSNFLFSLSVLKGIICDKKDSKTNEEQTLPETFFKFSSDTINKPSTITITFHIAEIRYTYLVSYCNNTIFQEVLEKQIGTRKPLTVFNRTFNTEKDVVEVSFPDDIIKDESQTIIQQSVIKNTSVISVYDGKNFESQDLKNVYSYFDDMDIYYAYESIPLHMLFNGCKDKEALKPILLKLLNNLGSNIIDYEINTFKVKMDESEAIFFRQALGDEEFNKRFPGSERKSQVIRFAHHAADTPSKVCWLNENEESDGTLNMIKLIIVLYDACKRNTPIAIDECSTGIHQQTFGRIIQFFLATSNNLQVIMSSQQISIMEMDGFRRDTVKFFDKDRETGITSCIKIDLRKYHKNQSIVNTYLNNSFGCLPEFPDMNTWKELLIEYRKLMFPNYSA